MNGMSLYFTFCMYSLYPVSPSSSTCSSFRMRLEMIGIYSSIIRKEISDPSTSGIARNRNSVLIYIG